MEFKQPIGHSWNLAVAVIAVSKMRFITFIMPIKLITVIWILSLSSGTTLRKTQSDWEEPAQLQCAIIRVLGGLPQLLIIITLYSQEYNGSLISVVLVWWHDEYLSNILPLPPTEPTLATLSSGQCQRYLCCTVSEPVIRNWLVYEQWTTLVKNPGRADSSSPTHSRPQGPRRRSA